MKRIALYAPAVLIGAAVLWVWFACMYWIVLLLQAIS